MILCNDEYYFHMTTLYVETSFINYLTARPSRDVIVAGHQLLSKIWWETSRQAYDMYITQMVIQEASDGDPDAAKERLQITEDMTMLDLNEHVLTLSESLIRESALPKKAKNDAVHIAAAAVHRIKYIMTWNCSHMANAVMRPVIERVCSANGYIAPIICTPEELMEGQS